MQASTMIKCTLWNLANDADAAILYLVDVADVHREDAHDAHQDRAHGA